MGTKSNIQGYTALIATSCDPELLPSAVIVPLHMDHAPFCVHSMRAMTLEQQTKFLANFFPNDKPKSEEPEFVVYPFYEEYPTPSHTCVACRQMDNVHDIRDNAGACTMTTDDCA